MRYSQLPSSERPWKVARRSQTFRNDSWTTSSASLSLPVSRKARANTSRLRCSTKRQKVSKSPARKRSRSTGSKSLITNFGGSPLIPSVGVGQPVGELFIATIEGGDTVNATLEDNPEGTINRDSDFDNGIIAHEYGHGISNRLTGGPSNVGCLVGSEQAGEGWSDFWTLVLTAKPGHTRTTARGVGNYVLFLPETGAGIRNFVYTTDLEVNPQTYGDIGNTNAPHGVGEIWMSMLWEVYWNLVDKLGFDPDLYFGTGGNNLPIQLVMDGMKLQPCLPDFVEARDAILLADQVNNGGANQCEIWEGFAKRGLGHNAYPGSPLGVPSAGNEIEAFDLPAFCDPDGLFWDGFESGDTTAWNNTVP